MISYACSLPDSPAAFHQRGFTLVEMAMVLVVMGLLLGGLLMPMARTVEAQKQGETRTVLTELRDALTGYAMVNGRLPCPDTSGDGQENSGCPSASNTFTTGSIPWATLGVEGADAWGNAVRYTVNGAFTVPFDLSTSGTGAGVLNIYDTQNCVSGNVVASGVPAVLYSDASERYATAPEAENRDGDNCYINRTYNTITGTEFDDIVDWLSPNVLFSKLVTAGVLP